MHIVKVAVFVLHLQRKLIFIKNIHNRNAYIITQKQKKMAKRKRKRFKITFHYGDESRNAYANDVFEMRSRFRDSLLRNFKDKVATWKMEDGHQISPQEWQGQCVTLKLRTVRWHLVDSENQVSKAAAIIGAIGGRAGVGKAKRRGDSNYYRNLRLLGTLNKKIKLLKNKKSA
jgi:hypothetical protein